MPYNIEHFNVNNITAHLTGLTTEDELDINIVEPDLVSEAIRKTPQKLSNSEQIQARSNIGAASKTDVLKIKPIVINGDITNTPDEEDITMDSNNLLKLKNRTSLNGLGYIILRLNINLSEQITSINTIYEIRYDFDLNENDITIPENCKLYFNGGSFRNGTLIGNNTEIIGKYCFELITLSGSFDNDYIYANWFKTVSDYTTILNNLSSLCTSNIKPLKLDKRTYTITDTITFNNASFTFRGIYGNNTIISYNTIESKPAFLITHGSGKESNATISNIEFIGSSTSTGIEVRGACQVYIDKCNFYTNLYGIVYSNNVSAGTFTEGCVANKCRFGESCSNSLRYYAGSGDSSFHGSGMTNCWIDVKPQNSVIIIEPKSLPYNSPLTFKALCNNNKHIILNNNTDYNFACNFYGNINVEGNDMTLVNNGKVYFSGTINVLGNSTNGSLIYCDRIEKRGPNNGNKIAMIHKTKGSTVNITSGSHINLSCEFNYRINFPHNDAYMEINVRRSVYGGNPVFCTPILCLNSSWIENNISITFGDGVIIMNNISSNTITIQYISTYTAPDAVSGYF